MIDKVLAVIKSYFNLPQNLYTKDNQYLVVASFFGAGYFKKAPGTFASFVTVILAIILNAISHNLVIIFTFLIIILGFYVCNKIVTNPKEDPSYIVIDEVAGQLIALLLIKNSIPLILLSFIIFRILDIKKPWIIKQSETSFSGGHAVMMDDILAGFITLLITVGVKIIFGI